MIELMEKVVAGLIVALFACLSTVKTVGIMQQSGYKNAAFLAWLRRKDNLQFNRLAVLSLCLALSTSVVSLCFSFLGVSWALLLSALPFFGLFFLFCKVDEKYALKVRGTRTGRSTRLFAVYFVLTAFVAYVFIAVLNFLAVVNGSKLYGLIAYAPFSALPMLLPFLLCLANLTTAPFERAHNAKFVKRAGQVLDETKITRVAVVGSYGKTSVKNIVKTLLAEKYAVVETPASYNTPVGIAKTVLSDEFQGKQIFIAEMGARRQGDIDELCRLVKPDYALFTGVCAQHIQTFASVENILQEKSEVVRFAKKTFCGEGLQGKVEGEVAFAGVSQATDVKLGSRETQFSFLYRGERVRVKTRLLGRSAVENILLAVALCEELGLTAQELLSGFAKLEPVPHRLQLIESGGAYILDDGYNCNEEGAQVALEVLSLHEGRKCVVTPGIVEGGILEETLNGRLGETLAGYDFDRVILVGDTLVGAIKSGYLAAGGSAEKLCVTRSLELAQARLAEWIKAGDGVLFLNDLPDIY